MDAVPLSTGNEAYDSLNARLSELESQLSSIKIATPELINIIDDETPLDQKVEIMTNLLFEDIGGQEIINIIRNDIVNGQNITYQPIKNVTSLYYQYNPQNILPLQKTDKDYFKNFSIILYNKIPECGSGFNIIGDQQVPNCDYIYINPTNGDIVIDLINMRPEEEVEVQIISKLNDLHDTIY